MKVADQDFHDHDLCRRGNTDGSHSDYQNGWMWSL